MENLTLENFKTNIGSGFQAQIDENNAVQLEIKQCEDLGSTPQQEQFSVILRGPLQPLLIQKIYRLKHDVLGEHDLFVVPIRQDGEATFYEIIFNRFSAQK